jgi:hypothetical protein
VFLLNSYNFAASQGRYTNPKKINAKRYTTYYGRNVFVFYFKEKRLILLTGKTNVRIISCSVLKAEIQKLIRQGDLDAGLVFVSKYFHVDYSLIEANLRRIIQQNLPRSPQGIVLVYGDLCLGPNNEMKKLAEEYGITKVDALNCVDCLLGGKGKSLQVDPKHELMLMNPGMTDFFERIKEKARQEGVDEEALKGLFSGLKGIVLLDTLGESNKNREELEKLNTGLAILETKTIGLEHLKQVIIEAIERNNLKKAQRSPNLTSSP